MVCNVRMALRLDPETGMIAIRGYGQDSRVISLRLASEHMTVCSLEHHMLNIWKVGEKYVVSASYRRGCSPHLGPSP